MGTWLVMLVAALGLMVWGRRIIDEVYSLAVYVMSVLMLIFGLAIAPANIVLMVGLIALGWLQFRVSKS